MSLKLCVEFIPKKSEKCRQKVCCMLFMNNSHISLRSKILVFISNLAKAVQCIKKNYHTAIVDSHVSVILKFIYSLYFTCSFSNHFITNTLMN